VSIAEALSRSFREGLFYTAKPSGSQRNRLSFFCGLQNPLMQEQTYQKTLFFLNFTAFFARFLVASFMPFL
jgi:hypothetical protein